MLAENKNEKIDRILEHPEFRRRLQELNVYEADRSFCRHDIIHFLDVARIAYIIVLRKGLPYSMELVYGTALLHDIGRIEQYKTGKCHARASAEIAPVILKDAGFSGGEIDQAVEAIKKHRKITTNDEQSLTWALYKADKVSRNCFICQASADCDWDEDSKNRTEWMML